MEAGLAWVVHWDHEFVGKEKLLAQKDAGTHDRLVGIRATGRGIPREGVTVQQDEADVGIVTSGTMSPNLKTGIALAYVRPAACEPGTALSMIVRDRPIEGVVTKPPFV